MATSDNKDTGSSSSNTSNKDTSSKEDNDILSFGDSSSSRKNDIIKTDILGFPIKLDLLTAGIGGIALLGLGIAGYQLWMNTQKQQEEEARRRQIEQQKQARYLQYLKNQEMILKQQEAQKAELIEKQRTATPTQGQGQHPNNYGPISSYNNIDDPEVSYGDPNLHSGLSGLNLESDIDPYNKSSRLVNTTRNYTPASIDMSYNDPAGPSLTNQRISAYNEQPQYIPPAAPPVKRPINNAQMIQPGDPTEPDLLPIEFSNPSTPPPSPNQPPQQRNRREVQHEQEQEEQQDREERDISGEYEQGLSPDELMNSINNSNYYN